MSSSVRTSIRHGRTCSRSSPTAWWSATRNGGLALFLVVAAALLAACGEKDEPEAGSETPTAVAPGQRNPFEGGADREKYIGRSGTATKTACELLTTSEVERVVAAVE